MIKYLKQHKCVRNFASDSVNCKFLAPTRISNFLKIKTLNSPGMIQGAMAYRVDKNFIYRLIQCKFCFYYLC